MFAVSATGKIMWVTGGGTRYKTPISTPNPVVNTATEADGPL